METKTKICKILNGRFFWELHVDHRIILFEGLSAAKYFESHYKDLGYKVITKFEEEETDD